MDVNIATYHLKEDKVFRNLFECAAWYEDVLVKAGDYPMTVHQYSVGQDGQVGGHCMAMYAIMQGEIVKDEFGAIVGGIHIGKYDNYQNRGKPSYHYLLCYMHSVAKSILDNDGIYELDEGYEAREIQFVDFEGKPKTTYGIFKM